MSSKSAKSSSVRAGDELTLSRAGWSFNKDVAKTFVPHAKKSIPGYEEGHEIVCALSDFFLTQDCTCYEFGVSTGELMRKLIKHNSHKNNLRWIGVDREQPMIEQAAAHCKGLKDLELVCDDIRTMALEPADFVVSYYTIQFIPPRNRQDVIRRIYDTLNWGGAFVWFEKVRGPDARFQDILTNLYTNFKLNHGFSADEILGKAESIKGVMEPFSSSGNRGLLERAGFVDIMPVYRNLCFEGVLCIK